MGSSEYFKREERLKNLTFSKINLSNIFTSRKRFGERALNFLLRNLRSLRNNETVDSGWSSQKPVGPGWFNTVPSRLALNSRRSRSRNKLCNQELDPRHFHRLATGMADDK